MSIIPNLSRTFRQSIDLITLSVFLALLIVGWLMVYSVGFDENIQNPVFNIRSAIGKQSLWIIIALTIMGLVLLLDVRIWQRLAYPIYAISILALAGVLIFGLEINGSKSWYSIFGLTIQPSELTKFSTALAISAYFSSSNQNNKNTRFWLVGFLIILLPAALILLQPDAGSALVFSSFLILFYKLGLNSDLYLFAFTAMAVTILGLIFEPIYILISLSSLFSFIILYNLTSRKLLTFLALLPALFSLLLLQYEWFWGARLISVISVLGLCVALYNNLMWSLGRRLLILFLWSSLLTYTANYAFFNILKPHQQDRINVWLRPSFCDPRGSLYNITQSKMAIGSGGLLGKGFMEGTMTKLNYVPEQMTDFIFCTVGEEQGFIGVFGIVLMFLILILRILTIGDRQRSVFVRNYAYAVAGIMFFHLFVNIGMTMGLVPVIGIPLPFISKGGSSLIGFSLLIGVLLKLDMEKLRA